MRPFASSDPRRGTRRMVGRSTTRGIFMLAGFLLFGCTPKPEINSYTVPRERGAMPFRIETLPREWTQGVVDQFSAYAFVVPPLKGGGKPGRVTVSGLRSAGDDFVMANVQRWQGQIRSTKKVAIDDLETIKLPTGKARMILLKGEQKAIIGGIIEYNGESWSFKMSGPPDLCENQLDDFRKFMGSVIFDKSEAEDGD